MKLKEVRDARVQTRGLRTRTSKVLTCGLDATRRFSLFNHQRTLARLRGRATAPPSNSFNFGSDHKHIFSGR